MTEPLIIPKGFLSAIAPLIQETTVRQEIDDNGQFVGPDHPFEVIKSIDLNQPVKPSGFERFLAEKYLSQETP